MRQVKDANLEGVLGWNARNYPISEGDKASETYRLRQVAAVTLGARDARKPNNGVSQGARRACL
jgi:hypothetical protein